MKSEKTLLKCVSFFLITPPPPNCERTIKADVVAFDQPFFYNRLGAVNPSAMLYALRRDVKAKPCICSSSKAPGNIFATALGSVLC